MASPAVNVSARFRCCSDGEIVVDGLQVVRYSALAAGVFYGVVHKRTLQKNKAEQEHHHAQHRKDELVKQAKEAWQRKQSAGKGDGGLSFSSVS